ncbi:MAG TPA: putative Ig domain-containing protein [Pseudonocardiaceae bacterium]|nr:putative Ig domain-containing protein [Pseudonocardiaceae bacterium]
MVAVVGVLLAAIAAAATTASAATPAQLDLKILLIGTGSADPTSAAWQAALDSEGVPYTVATASGAYGSETVSLPALTTGAVGNYNGIVLADSPTAFGTGVLNSLFSYESSFGVRQVDGYMFPDPALGVTDVSSGALDGTTGTLTSAGLAALPELKGPVPFDTGTFGYPAALVPGASFTPWLENSAGNVLAGVYQHPGGDPQANVSELALNFDYNASQLQWLLLAPGLINWVTQDTHLGLYRNYFGEDVDDLFIADNEWSAQNQCTPAATDPVDVGCPTAAQGNPADGPPDTQMSAADVAYVANWEQQTGIKLELAFNAIGACTGPTTAAQSTANCTGSTVRSGTNYTDPGHVVDTDYPDDGTFVNALLADQGDFNWITHTWSHLFLGCEVWQPLPLSTHTAGTGGSLSAGSYSYEVTAATAYGESEPSTPAAIIVGAGGSASLSWADATNGGGPSLAAMEANHTGGTGFWGYDVYRADPGSSSYGLVGQVAENPSGGTATYSFTDTGATAPGDAPGTTDTYPTATDPGIECAGSGGADWTPATSATPDASIEQEIGLDDAFAANNGLANFNANAVVTGEHSGLENPNLPAAFTGTGITTFAADASRQPNQYTVGAAQSAPRYPSNIYYNASNWPDELNEYNSLYVAQGSPLGDSRFPGETGRCTDTSATTCVTTPATESTVLANESHIMLSHVLANNPRVGYTHQSNLIGPAAQAGTNGDYGYTLLTLINSMLSQYNAWYTAPLAPMTDATEVQVLDQQSGWAAAKAAGSVTGTVQNGSVVVTNSSGAAVTVPITVPPGTTVNGTAFGTAYGGSLSAWTSIGAHGSQTLAEKVAPTITSGSTANSIVGAPFSFTVATTGAPVPAITRTGALPAGLTYTDNGNGTATIAGTPGAGSGNSYPLTFTATSSAGTTSQSFTLTNAEAPSITSPSTALFAIGAAGTYTVTTTGYPAATITESGALPSGLTFTDNGTGTATIAGTPATGTAGSYPVTISATNASGSTTTLSLAISVQIPVGPQITSGASAFFTKGANGAFAVTTTGAPTPALTETGALPAGLTFVDNGNGTALLSGTPTVAGTVTLTVTATNAAGSTSQTFSVIVGQAPAFTSAATSSFTIGSAGTFTVLTTGYPAAAIGESGTLPSGLAFTDNGAGTATIAGTPAAGTGGSYPVTLTAVNGTGTVHQTLTIAVNQAPAITSAASLSSSTLRSVSFAVKGTGYPLPTMSVTGLPLGLSFSGGSNGTGTISGLAVLPGTYHVMVKAQNAAGIVNQTLTVTVSLF